MSMWGSRTGGCCFWRWGLFLREGVVDREVLWADVAELVCERGKNWEGGPDLQVSGEREFRVAFTSATARYQVRDLAAALSAHAQGGGGGPEVKSPSGTAGGAEVLAAAG
jgi:hypothetical protein